MIYFIGAGDDGPVKIGYTRKSAQDRMAALQTGNPDKLTILATFEGTQKDESAIHRTLASHRLNGEWFKRQAAVEAIEQLRKKKDEVKSVVAQRVFSEYAWRGPMALYWEVEGDPITDDYLPSEIDARDLWTLWKSTYGVVDGLARISWFIYGPGFMEMAPVGNQEVRDISEEDYYTFFDHPVDAETGEVVPWLSLPVVDKMWNAERADKGGFIQQASGWKPSPFQQVMDVEVIEQAINLGDKDFRDTTRAQIKRPEKPKGARTSFKVWLRTQVDRNDPIGHLAADVAEDKDFPTSRQWNVYEDYLNFQIGATQGAHDALELAWLEWSESLRLESVRATK